MELVTTVCPYCAVGCSFDVEVEDGHARCIEYRTDHPVSEGALCPKGNAALDLVYHPERLRYPLLRKDGKLERVGWDEAIRALARGLAQAKDKGGPDAVGFLASAKCTNEDNYLIQKLGRVFGTNSVDHCARLCHASTVSGLAMTIGAGAATNPLSDMANSDCLFVIGSNFPENHPVSSRWALDAKANGAKIVLADPRRTPVAWSADLHMQLQPGTDVPLINGMIHVILREGLHDEAFIRARTTGFDELAALARDVDLEEVSKITGVPVAAIEEAALAYGKAKAASIVWSMGITQHTHGTDNVASLANLALITGNIGRPGAGLLPLRGQNNVQGACDMGGLATLFPGYVPVTDAAGRAHFEAGWGVEDLPAENGLTIVEMFNAAADGKLHALYVIGENPLVTDPNTAHVKEAIEALDFIAVQDIFMTETAEIADLVLPAACTFEKDGTVTAAERRVQWMTQVVPPPGEARPDWEIVCDVAEALGYGHLFQYESADAILREINALVPQYAGITPERVKAPGGLVWPCPTVEHPGTPILHTESFKTPDGLGKLMPISYRPSVESADEAYPLILTTGRVVLHYNSGSMTRRTPALDSREPDLFVEINPDDASAREVEDGDTVRVWSRRGETHAKAMVTEKVKPGVIFMPFHFVGTNALTIEALDPIAKIPELKVAACQVGRV